MDLKVDNSRGIDAARGVKSKTAKRMPSTRRTQNLKRAFMAEKPSICPGRNVLVTESYKETEALEPVLRQAMAFARTLDDMPLWIRDQELIVSNLASRPGGSFLFPEYDDSLIIAEMDTISARCVGVGGECGGACLSVCPVNALQLGNEDKPVVDWQACNACGRCTQVCPTGALDVVGRDMTVDEVKSPDDVVVRFPVIPGCNDAVDTIRATADFVTGLGFTQIELIPYHKMGVSKYTQYGMAYPLIACESPSESAMARLREAVPALAN